MPTLNVRGANGTKGETLESVIRSLSRTLACQAVATAAVAALTDNSTGVSSNSFTIPAAATATPASGSNLATSASVNTALGTVKDAVATLYAKLNPLLTALGLPTVSYTGGGTSGGNVIAAITKTTTGSTTGVVLAEYEATRLMLNGWFTRLHGQVNEVAAAVGINKLPFAAGATSTSTGAVAATATNAATGVTKAKADADFSAWADDVAVIAAKLNAIRAVTGALQVVVID